MILIQRSAVRCRVSAFLFIARVDTCMGDLKGKVHLKMQSAKCKVQNETTTTFNGEWRGIDANRTGKTTTDFTDGTDEGRENPQESRKTGKTLPAKSRAWEVGGLAAKRRKIHKNEKCGINQKNDFALRLLPFLPTSSLLSLLSSSGNLTVGFTGVDLGHASPARRNL